MIAIAVFAFISTIAFYRIAKTKGLHPGKAASIPFVFAGIWFITAYLISKLISDLENPFGISGSTLEKIIWMADLFLVLTYLAAISKYWKNISNASDVN